MKNKNRRLDAIKVIISTKEIGSQEELRIELEKEGFALTQATLSRDLKQLKVAKAATIGGKYVYVLPNNTLYKRVNTPWLDDTNSPRDVGFRSIVFSNNIAVIKTRPGYASSLAYDIDDLGLDEVCGTIAGDDTLMIILKEKVSRVQVIHALSTLIPGIQ
ncbi:MAG: arginine repressor [Bacteroidaceae bacterium]|nr:arginine repressor [Bacteroidaceae bacterium]